MISPSPRPFKLCFALSLLLSTAVVSWPSASAARPKLMDQTDRGSYQTSYQNLSVAGDSTEGAGPVVLIAGSHEQNFPYWGTAPWDNGLLLFGGEGYHFTHRTLGQALELIFDVNPTYGWIYYQGEMTRASDQAVVEAKIYFTVRITEFETFNQGTPLNLLTSSKIPGMRWQPVGLTAGWGTACIDEQCLSVQDINGELERGQFTNLKSPKLAIAYDYVCLAKPGPQGYAFVDFVSHPLDDSGILGNLLDKYLVKTASESFTLQNDQLHDGNVYDVYRPAQTDAEVVLFENSVDLGLANLRRQMIAANGQNGDVLYGLREIFEKK